MMPLKCRSCKHYATVQKKIYHGIVEGYGTNSMVPFPECYEGKGEKTMNDLEALKDEICENVCRWREKAFEIHKDPDDAEKWLDKNYCSQGCPAMKIGEQNTVI